MKKRFSILSLALVLVFSFAGGVFASSNLEKISAWLNKEVKITFNGALQEFKNEKGDVVYPITYNGTTYLPVRSAADLVKLSVEWDQDTRTVKLSEKMDAKTDEMKDMKEDKNIKYLKDIGDPSYTKKFYEINKPELLTVNGKTYKHGFVFINPDKYSPATSMDYNVKGKKELVFTVYSPDHPLKLTVNSNEGFVESVQTKKGEVKTFTIKLINKRIINIEADNDEEATNYIFEAFVR